ncbi:MAG: class I adenylate-forming enzyme family protein [Beijerinckiaceae bacterium]
MRLLLQQIRLHALAQPARPAIMLADRVITFGMVQSGIDSVRQVLFDLRLEPDTCIGVLVDNPARHFIIALALISNGHAFAPLRVDLVSAAKAAGMTTLISDAPLSTDTAVRAISADENWFMRQNAPQRPLPHFQPNRIVQVAFTSGSTGRPKPIAYTERALSARVARNFLVGIGKTERIMSAYGISGPGFQQALQMLTCGRTICFAPPPDILRVTSYYNVEELRGSVAQIRGLLNDNETAGRPVHLKQISAGGAYLPYQLAQEIRESFRADLICPYSAVEAGGIGCASGELLKLRAQRGNCYSVLTDIEIVDDDDNVLPDGTDGRIRVRSPQTARPFDGSLVEPEHAWKEWVTLGDIGRIEPDGLLVLTGRNDEVINFGGAKVDPEVIENLLRTHPAVEDAAVLRMIGSDGLHEAWAVLKSRGVVPLEAINAWLSARLTGELGAFHLTRVEIVSEIPKTPTAKVARGALRKMVANGGC